MVYEINETSFEKGNLSEWTKYQQDYLSPMNKRFRESKGLEYVKIRENLKLEMEVMTDWEPWGVCEICGRPPDQGRRRKKGFCRLKINPKTKSVNFNELHYKLGTYGKDYILKYKLSETRKFKP